MHAGIPGRIESLTRGAARSAAGAAAAVVAAGVVGRFNVRDIAAGGRRANRQIPVCQGII